MYRAHIVQTEIEKTTAAIADEYRIFNDLQTEQSRQALSTGDLESQLPTLDEITSFYRGIFTRAQMESDTIIMSLIYVERLIKCTVGKLRPGASNWRSILFSCMLLASKVWDDLSSKSMIRMIE